MVARKGHGGLSQNRKRRVIGEDSVEKGQRRRAAQFHRYLHAGSSRVIPQWPSARLTPGLKRNTGQRFLRFSVLRETSRTSALNVQFQKVKMLRQPLLHLS